MYEALISVQALGQTLSICGGFGVVTSLKYKLDLSPDDHPSGPKHTKQTHKPFPFHAAPFAVAQERLIVFRGLFLFPFPVCFNHLFAEISKLMQS